jgi:hypothetical protein
MPAFSPIDRPAVGPFNIKILATLALPRLNKKVQMQGGTQSAE